MHRLLYLPARVYCSPEDGMDFPKHTGIIFSIVLLGFTLHCVLDWIYCNKYFRKYTVKIFDISYYTIICLSKLKKYME
jgi:hypothetical protein